MARSISWFSAALGWKAADASKRLYKNNRDGTFTGVTGLLGTGWASAVTVGDYDNDGFDDIFVTYYGNNVLYRNSGNGTFSDVTEKSGIGQAAPANLSWL